MKFSLINEVSIIQINPLIPILTSQPSQTENTMADHHIHNDTVVELLDTVPISLITQWENHSL